MKDEHHSATPPTTPFQIVSDSLISTTQRQVTQHPLLKHDARACRVAPGGDEFSLHPPPEGAQHIHAHRRTCTTVVWVAGTSLKDLVISYHVD